jgi:tetratricopeptide (TPR) repeat protein
LRGHFVDAGTRLGEGAEQVRRAGGANQPASVFADSVLGMFLYQTGRGPEGLALLANARDRITQRLGPAHPRTVDATVLYADLLVAEGRADEAIELVAPFAAEEIPYRPIVETVLGKAFLQKREFSRAESVLQSAIAAFEKRKARRGRWWTEALLTRGELKLAEGQWQAAQLNYDEVIAAIEETGAGAQFAVRARAGAARVALALGDWTAARRHQVQAVAAISDPRVDGLLARYSADLTRLGTCLAEAEKGRPPKPSLKGICAA